MAVVPARIACLTGQVELRCFGGFVVAQHYGLGRETSDIDFVAAIMESRADDLESLAGMHSGLYRKYVVQEPLTSWDADLAATRNVLDRAGPCVLVL